MAQMLAVVPIRTPGGNESRCVSGTFERRPTRAAHTKESRMRTTSKMAGIALGTAALVPFMGAGIAQAADGGSMATLRPVALNGVQANGTAMVTVHGNRVDVTMAASGLLPDNPHAAHIHFGAEARHECPRAGDDANGDN